MKAKTIALAEVQQELEKIIDHVVKGNERITLTQHEKPIAAIVPIEDLIMLEAFEDELDIQAAQKALMEKGSISLDELIGLHG